MEQEKRLSTTEVIGLLAAEVVRLDACVRELAAALKTHTETFEAMVDATEIIDKQHGKAFAGITEHLRTLGCEVGNPEIDELRKLYERPSDQGEPA